MSPEGLRAKNDCADDDQQRFTQPNKLLECLTVLNLRSFYIILKNSLHASQKTLRVSITNAQKLTLFIMRKIKKKY